MERQEKLKELKAKAKKEGYLSIAKRILFYGCTYIVYILAIVFFIGAILFSILGSTNLDNAKLAFYIIGGVLLGLFWISSMLIKFNLSTMTKYLNSNIYEADTTKLAENTITEVNEIRLEQMILILTILFGSEITKGIDFELNKIQNGFSEEAKKRRILFQRIALIITLILIAYSIIAVFIIFANENATLKNVLFGIDIFMLGLLFIEAVYYFIFLIRAFKRFKSYNPS